MEHSNQQPGVPGHFDALRRYVRICRERADGFVEFEFAIGAPELFVELMLPAGAFHEFCLANGVIVLEPLAGEGSDTGDWVQRLNDATHREFGDAE